jgi:hypothetical protein
MACGCGVAIADCDVQRLIGLWIAPQQAEKNNVSKKFECPVCYNSYDMSYGRSLDCGHE